MAAPIPLPEPVTNAVLALGSDDVVINQPLAQLLFQGIRLVT
jgi:hypothetical protein